MCVVTEAGSLKPFLIIIWICWSWSDLNSWEGEVFQPKDTRMKGNLDQDRAIVEIWLGPITSRVAYDVVPFPPRLSGRMLWAILDGVGEVLQVPRSDFRGRIPFWDFLEYRRANTNFNSPGLISTSAYSSHTNKIMDLHQKPLLEPFQTFKFHWFFDIARIKGEYQLFSLVVERMFWVLAVINDMEGFSGSKNDATVIKSILARQNYNIRESIKINLDIFWLTSIWSISGISVYYLFHNIVLRVQTQKLMASPGSINPIL